jgi:hypothetical protein
MADRYYEVEIRGTCPILFYNPRLSDPLDDYSKELKKVSKKSNKSEDDHLRVSQIEFQGALHFHDGEDGRDAMGPVIPGEMLEATIREGCQRGLGVKFEKFVRSDDPVGFRLEYEGPRTREGLWKAGSFVDRRSASPNKKTRVMRSRPIFRHWSCKFTLCVVDGGPDAEQLRDALVTAGTRGMGSYRKRYGRFVVVSFRDATKDLKDRRSLDQAAE